MSEKQDQPQNKQKMPRSYFLIIVAGLALFIIVISPLDFTFKAACILIIFIFQLIIAVIHSRVKDS